MPGSIAVAGPADTAAVTAVTRTLAIPRTSDVNALGRAAAAAVRRIATAANHPLPTVHAKPSEDVRFDRRVILVGAAVLAAVVALASPLRNRPRRSTASS